MSAKKQSPLIKLAGLGILVIALHFVWKGLGMVTTYVADLQVQGTNTVVQSRIEEPTKQEALKALAPLTVQAQPDSAAKAEESAREKADLINKSFKAPEAAVKSPLEVPVVDGFKTLEASTMVFALFKDGANINGSYYHKGDKMPALEYPLANGGRATPWLETIGANDVTVREGKTGRRLRLPLVGP